MDPTKREAEADQAGDQAGRQPAPTPPVEARPPREPRRSPVLGRGLRPLLHRRAQWPGPRQHASAPVRSGRIARQSGLAKVCRSSCRSWLRGSCGHVAWVEPECPIIEVAWRTEDRPGETACRRPVPQSIARLFGRIGWKLPAMPLLVVLTAMLSTGCVGPSSLVRPGFELTDPSSEEKRRCPVGCPFAPGEGGPGRRPDFGGGTAGNDPGGPRLDDEGRRLRATGPARNRPAGAGCLR